MGALFHSFSPPKGSPRALPLERHEAPCGRLPHRRQTRELAYPAAGDSGRSFQILGDCVTSSACIRHSGGSRTSMQAALKMGKGAVQAIAGAMGFEIRRRRDELGFLRSYGFRSVLDIGANCGQFACHARRLLPEAAIHSFEPLPDVFDNLRKRMAGDPHFSAHQLALGEAEGEVVMYRNESTPSSSLLPICDSHLRAFPHASRTEPVTARVCTLDSWARGRDLERPLLIKLDVQGFEDRVIEGGKRTIGRAHVVVSEVSFVELYQGQVLFDGIHAMLRDLGFRCVGMVGNICEPSSGHLLQADAIFEGIDAGHGRPQVAGSGSSSLYS